MDTQQYFEQILTGLGYQFYEDGMMKTSYHTKQDLQELMERVWNLALNKASLVAQVYYDGDNIAKEILNLKLN